MHFIVTQNSLPLVPIHSQTNWHHTFHYNAISSQLESSKMAGDIKHQFWNFMFVVEGLANWLSRTSMNSSQIWGLSELLTYIASFPAQKVAMWHFMNQIKHHTMLTVVDVNADVVLCRLGWLVVGCVTRGVPNLWRGGIVTLSVGWLAGADVGNVSDAVITTLTGPADCCWCWGGWSGAGGCDTSVELGTFGSCKLLGESAEPPSLENTDG